MIGMKRIYAAALLALLGAWTVLPAASAKAASGEEEKVHQRVQNSAKDLKQLMGAPDSAIPREALESAKCIAVVPDLTKGGFIFGAEHGRGVATCRTPRGWSEPAFFVVTGGSWGAQIGLQSVDLVMLIMNDKGMQDLLSSKFRLGASGAVAAGPVGRQAQASTDWKMKAEVLVYSRARGLYAGLDLSGAVIKSDHDATKAFYGKEIPSSEILAGNAPKESAAKPLLAAVNDAYKVAVASR